MDAVATATLVSIALATNGLAAVFAQFAVIRITKPPARILMRLGSVLIFAAVLSFIGVTSEVTMVGTFAILGLGIGMLGAGNAAGISLSVGTEELGAATVLLTSMRAFGFATAPLFAPPMYGLYQPGPYLINLALLGSTIILVWLHPTIGKIGAAP